MPPATAPAPVPAPAPAPVAPGKRVTASGQGAIAAGGNIASASTGGTTPPVAPSQNSQTAPSAAPAPAPGPGPGTNVTASGHGSIAAGGDIGSASTGT